MNGTPPVEILRGGCEGRAFRPGRPASRVAAQARPGGDLRDDRRDLQSLHGAAPGRRLADGDRPKVVFCTTENDVAHIARALHAGANEYIMKPFDKEIVEAKFQEVGLI